MDKDLKKQSDHWNITAPTGIGTNDRILKLTAADFGGVLDHSKISINDTEYHDDPNNIIEVREDRKEQKQALLDLESLLKSLIAKYGDLTKVENGKGPDFDFIDGSADLGETPSPANPVPKNGLWAYVTGKLDDFDNITAEAENIKHILYELDYYENKIEKFISCLERIKKALALGIKKFSEIIIFIDKTIGGGYEEPEFPEILKEPGFYKGFPLIDPNLQAIPDPDDDNNFKISKKDPNKPVRFTKEKIDNFRDFSKAYHGPNSDIFTKEKTIKDKDGKDVKVYANRLPEECMGFQPGDVNYQIGNGYFYVNGGMAILNFEGRSKIHLDILAAQNAEEAMDLAFFGKDYDEPVSESSIRKGNPAFGSEKYPNVNLLFNEVKGWNRQETLNHYYEALKNLDFCSWTIPGDAAGDGSEFAPKYDDPDTKKKIDAGYILTKEFIVDYENYIDTDIANLDKTQLEATKTKLEKWKITRFYTSGGVWVSVIDNFLVEVDDALSHLNDDPDNQDRDDKDDKDDRDDQVPTWHTELAELKNRAGKLGKKIYQNCQPDQDEFTEAVFEELKKLVKLLEEAHGAKTTNIRTELEKFISDSNNDTNKNKALEIAQKVKNQDSDSENCVKTALERLKTPQEKQLEEAQAKLKSLLAGLKINGKDAYEEVITDIKDSEIDINKTIEIWQKCLEIDAATNDDNGKLLETINNFKNDSTTRKAWDAVNKYQRGEWGLADEMLKKLNDWAEQRKKDYRDIKNAKSKTEFEKAKEEFMKKPEYENNKQDYNQIYFPLSEKAAELREKGVGKEISELITVVVSDYNDWKTQLGDLEAKLNKLKSIPKQELETFSTAQKQALEKLVKKMEDRVQEWRAEKIKSESNSNSLENPAWYKTPLGVIGIISVVAILAGAIFIWRRVNLTKRENNKKKK